MNKILILIFIMNSAIFAFEDIYMSCTLINKYGKEVSLRQAKAQEKADIDLLITEDKLYFDNYYYTYNSTSSDIDVYGSVLNGLSGEVIFLNKGNQLIINEWDFSFKNRTKNYELKYKYRCKQEKSYLNKMKILSLSKLFQKK